MFLIEQQPRQLEEAYKSDTQELRCQCLVEYDHRDRRQLNLNDLSKRLSNMHAPTLRFYMLLVKV